MRVTNVKFSVSPPLKLSRGLLLLRTFLGWLYVGIPHGICLGLLGIGMFFCVFIAFWAILFTGRYPKSFFDFVVDVLDWQFRVGVYGNFLRDEYPPFGLGVNYPAKFSVTYPDRLSRGLLLLKLLFGWLYVGIPHGFCLVLRGIVHGIITFIAWWAVLFTGRISEKMFRFMSGTFRWQAGVMAYLYLLTDEYPAFTGRDESQAPGQTLSVGV
ncbi:MAG: DUF4389 domain-containing protein [Firmicutes bacterium]|nr:DUF4389 domain-containing protein [Bacillota bacterium]